MKKKAAALMLSAGLLPALCGGAAAAVSAAMADSAAEKLSAKYPQDADRARKGVSQTAARWTPADGSEQEFEAFCLSNFYVGEDLDRLFQRFDSKMEKIKGHNTALEIDLHREVEVDTGALLPADTLFAAYSPSVNVVDDMFTTKLAFVALLNFPLTSLEEKLSDGPSWSRKDWAQTRLAEKFEFRVPASAGQRISAAGADASAYINDYNIFMDRVVDASGKSPFRPGLSLISHWGLRDELIAMYSKPAENLPRQEIIYSIMERIIAQEIPLQVINSSAAYWNPASNTVDGKPAQAEPDTRYAKWLAMFSAIKDADQYYSSLPSHMARTFNRDMQISEEQGEKLLLELLNAPEGKLAAKAIQKRLGRKLRPFDIWYDGFRARPMLSNEELDAMIGKTYPSVAVFQTSLPGILSQFGFSQDKAWFLSSRIQVDPGRGGGHAYSAEMRGEKAHLRARFPEGKLDAQNFSVAMHELGHTVEQTFSLYNMDYSMLNGVPNSALSEAFAFIFEGKTYDILGVKTDGQDLHALDMFWNAREIAGVALVDLYSWRWLYGHPQATPAELKQAVAGIASDVWKKYYAPVLGVKDSQVFAIYSHLVMYSLYLPNYPVGYLAAAQIQEYMKGREFGPEMERMCSTGNVTPSLWMRKAVGEDISAQPLIRAAASALKNLK